MSELKKPIENSLESLSMTIPFSCRDWGQEKCDAWVYGIVCGWGDDCRAEFEKKFGWNAETFDRLKRLHAHFEELRRAQPENEAIVRCGECIHFEPYDGEEHKGDCNELVGLDSCMYEDDYCSYGARKPERSEAK